MGDLIKLGAVLAVGTVAVGVGAYWSWYWGGPAAVRATETAAAAVSDGVSYVKGAITKVLPPSTTPVVP